MAVDSKKAAILTMLDLSAAFDTIDHDMLLTRLHDCYGVRGNALKWMKSYLSGRMQYVSINGADSDPTPLLFGVPQGSILGLKAFKRYSCPVLHIIHKHNLEYQIYADDTQIYTFYSPDDPESMHRAISKVQTCVTDIKYWMTDNYLKLNEEKTEVIIIARKGQKSDTSIESVDIGGHAIVPSSTVRNLGVMIDSAGVMAKQISNICKGAFFMIRNISRIRRLLTTDAAKSLVHSFVSTKLDYCNSLLYGLPQYQLNRLQRVLNCAARVVAQVGRREPITNILMGLHWLPVCARIEYKILLLTFKAFMD